MTTNPTFATGKIALAFWWVLSLSSPISATTFHPSDTDGENDDIYYFDEKRKRGLSNADIKACGLLEPRASEDFKGLFFEEGTLKRATNADLKALRFGGVDLKRNEALYFIEAYRYTDVFCDDLDDGLALVRLGAGYRIWVKITSLGIGFRADMPITAPVLPITDLQAAYNSNKVAVSLEIELFGGWNTPITEDLVAKHTCEFQLGRDNPMDLCILSSQLLREMKNCGQYNCPRIMEVGY